ncbi:TonB-dependent receptor [Roseateles sp. BYS180W]|uniref:TonB-dependent receptor n=1 Tax=Roseateles rivi TaxID=3299028 RepID=A0ABW7FVH1_9BURK
MSQGLGLQALAQSDNPPTLPRTEVVGSSPMPGLGLTREQIPLPVQLLRAEDLQRSQALDLSAHMGRRLGSVTLNEVQGNPLQVDVNFRGYSASPLLGSAQGLSIYMDGMRLNQAFGDVVSWDLLPTAAIASVALMPGANPLFGLNTLGGAISIQTKDGLNAPGGRAWLNAGHGARRLGGMEWGAGQAALHGYATVSHFEEQGWRAASPSRAQQFFAKLGHEHDNTHVKLTLAAARSTLNGNGLQEERLLARDWASVYTQPDTTQNRSLLMNLSLQQQLSSALSLNANLWGRRISTRTFNGDINDDSLDQSLYQPNAAERDALAAAGYSGFPTAGENAANTPFPRWRCIANALLLDEPAEKCNALLNHTQSTQRQGGVQLQLSHQGQFWGWTAQSALGLALEQSRVAFQQSAELGYLTPERGVVGVGAWGDGVRGGTVDGEPYDTRVDLSGRTRTASAWVSTTLSLSRSTHLSLAGRYNRQDLSNHDAIHPGGGVGSLDGEHRFARFNPSLGLSFSPLAGLQAWAYVGQGSRAPSSVELGCADPQSPCKLPNAFAGDPPLKQVRTTHWDLGLRGGTPRHLQWSLGLFRADNRDDLLFVADDTSGFGYFKNFGKTRRQGLEASMQAQPMAGLQLTLNYTWLQATYRSAERVNGSSNSSNNSAVEDGLPGVDGVIDIRPGDRIPLLPKQLAKLGLDWQLNPEWSLSMDWQGVGSSTARGNENGQHEADGLYYLGSGRNPGYGVLNLGVRFKRAGAWSLSLQVNNALDRRYSSAAQLGPTGFDAQGNFRARPFARNSAGDYPLQHSRFAAPGAPRQWLLGLNYDF